MSTNLNKYLLTLNVKDAKGVELKGANNSATTSLDEVLSRYKGKVIYVDFWASWCAPCLAEVPASHALSRKLKDEKSDVVFLYLSRDEDMSAWEHKARSIELPDNDSFIILKNKAFTEFSNKFNLKTIPRYMIIGKKGEMVNQDAPRPSDPKLKPLLNYL